MFRQGEEEDVGGSMQNVVSSVTLRKYTCILLKIQCSK